MATLIWLGTTSTDSTVLANWKDQSTGLAPTAIATTDDFLFNADGAGNACVLKQSTFATLTTQDTWGADLTFDLATHNADAISFGNAQTIRFTTAAPTIAFSGNHPTTTPFFNHPVVFDGTLDYQGTYGREVITWSFQNGNSDPAFLCDGEYPRLEIDGPFTTDVSSDVSNTEFTKVECISLKMTSQGSFTNKNISADDTQKHIHITSESLATQQLVIENDVFDMRNAKLTLTAANSLKVPCTNDTTNYSGTKPTFYANLGDVVLAKGASFGLKLFVPNGLTLECNSLEIENGVFLLGGEEPNASSEIHLVKKPKIRGTWNFKPITDGIYRSFGRASQSMFALTAKEAHITDKLTVDGLIDPTGMEFTPVAANPGGVAANTIWVNSGDSNKLYFGSSEVGGGGAGGAVDSVFGRTGAVVATEGDYDLDELGDVDITSAAETQILRHDGTSFVNDYNDIMFLRVKAREAINKGEAIYIFDAHNSDVVGVKKAKADSSTTMPCIGVAYETLASGDEGLAVSFGKANGIAANFTEGQTMYVSATTAGALTNTKPTGNTHLIQNVGILMQAHASNAVVKITGIGRSNDVPNQFSVGGSITAGSFVKSGGASTEFLKADGSVDTNTYITTAYTDDDAITAVEGEATLDLTGDVSLAADKELTINESTYSSSSKNSDDTKVLVSADSTGTNDALFRVDTDAGFLRIGPQNTGYCHFYTDRNAFYFNRNIEMDGGSFQAYNDDLQILTTTTSGDATRIYVDAGVDECRVGIGNGFTSSNLPEKELHVRGNMVIEDPTSDGSSDHLLEIKSASSSTPDNARILVSADTDAKLPLIHLRDIEANSGTFSTHYSAYIGLDRATPIATGSAQNDLLIANGNYNKDIHFLTNPTSNGTQAQAKMTIAADGDIGIGTTSPAQKLHVNGTIRQTGATSAVLVADSNGDIGAASNLSDTDYSSFSPALSAAAWAPPAPATLADAIDRLAAYVITIPGAPPQIP